MTAFGNNFNMNGGLRPTLPGRFVNSSSDINPNEVPQDGSLCLFPRNDYREIYARQWCSNGLMEVTFVPEQRALQTQTEQQTATNAGMSEVLDRLDRIEKKLNQKPRYNKPKKVNTQGGKDNE